MKKILSFLFGVIFLATIVTTKVSAEQELIQVLQVNQKNVKAGQEIIVTLSLENNINKVDSYSGQFIYDKELFEEIDESNFITRGNWEELKYNSSNNKFIMINSIGSSEKESILQIKLIAKKDINIEPTDIIIGNVEASTGEEDISLKDENVDLEEKPNLPEGDIDNGGTEETPSNPAPGEESGGTEETPSNPDSGEENGETEDSNNSDSIVQTGESSLALTFIVMAISIVILITLIKNKKITKKDYKKICILKDYKKICIFLVFTLAIATSGKIYASYLSNGEITGDKKVDYDDIRLLQKHLIGLSNIKEEYLKNADLNNDNKITITDLSLLLKLVDKKTQYKAEIYSINDKYYFEKGKPIEFKFNANVTPKGTIDSVIVNGQEYKVKQLDDSKQYSIEINAYDKAGIYKLDFTKVKLLGDKEIKVDFTQEIEVLKDVPKVNNYEQKDLADKGKVNISFDLEDIDSSMLGGKIKILKDDKEVLNKDIIKGNNSIDLSINEDETYKATIEINYNRNSDKSTGDSANTGTIKIEKDIKLVINYNLNVSNLTLYDNEFNNISKISKGERFILAFNSTNSTDFYPEIVNVNGVEYKVEKKDNYYIAKINAFNEIGNKQLKINSLKLNNGKLLQVNSNNVIKIDVEKTVPTISDVTIEENIEKENINLSFNVNDEDKALNKFDVYLYDPNGDLIFKDDNITVNKYSKEVSISNKLTDKYLLKIVGYYTLLQDSTEVVTKELYSQEKEAKSRVIIESSQVNKKYLEKNDEVKITYNIKTNKKDFIKTLNINDTDIASTKEGQNQYSATLKVGTLAGKKNLTLTSVTFEDGTEVKVNDKESIEVLKDKISVDGLSIVDDYDNNKEKVFFNIIDKDNAFVSGKAQLISNNKVLQEVNVEVGENNLSFDVEEGVNYKFKVIATYNRDEDGTQTVENEELINQDIQMIVDYKISTSNLATYDNDGKQILYVDRNSTFKLRFESSNYTKFVPEKAIINSKEYTLTSIGTNLYEATLDGFSSAGVKSIKIEKLIMNNTKELEITENNTTKVEVLKLKPTSNNFSYEELSNNSVKVNFDIVDKEKSIKNSKVVVNDGSETIFTKDNLTVGKNEIEFKLNSSTTYTVKVTATYDLDSNILPNSDNEFEEDILNESITISKDAIEFKDIENLKLYKNDNDKVVEVKEVDVNSFNPKEYLAELNMKDLPKLYAEIKESKVENGNLVLTLNYDNVVQYSDNNKKNKNLEVVFGKVNDKNIATNSTATNANTKADSTDIYIPEMDRLSTMEGYDSNKVMIYHNIYELMPFYDSSLIIEYGNNISEDSILNKSKIKIILPYDEEDSMIASINTNNYSKVKKIKVIFEDESTKDYSVTFDKKLSDIAVYNIDELNVKYNYNNYILDASNDLINTITSKAKALDYKEQISSVTTEEESRIYVDYYNQYAKDKLDQVVLDLLSNIPEYNLYLDNEILKQKVEQDITQNNQLEKLLYTYNYFDKWYNFKMGGASLTDIIFINVNSLNRDKSIFDLVEGTINAGETNRKTENAYKFYESVMKDNYALGKENIGTFLEYFMKVLDGYSNGADWFTDHFTGMLEETQPLENMPLVTYRAWDFLKRRTNLLLPVLSAPKQKDIYMICTPSQMAIGSLNRYTAYLNGNTASIRNTMKEYANNMYSYYKTSSAFINNSEGILKNICQVQFDTRLNFPNGLGYQERGKTQDSVIKWVYEAANTFGWEYMDKVVAEAYADTSTSVYWLKGAILDGGKSFSTFTHESAHNLDSRYFYEGVARRKGTGYEDSADGLLTQSQTKEETLVFNLVKDRAITSDTVTNLTPERIAGKDKIYSYYKGMFDTTYVLDYLTAKAFLKLTPEEQAAIGVKVKYNNGESLDEGGSKLGYYRISADEFKALKLETIEDLINNGIALRGGGTDATGGSYGEDDFYSIYWYQPHDNDGNAPTKAFKRLAFEMLGVGGYTDGFVTFVSNKSDNDLDALRKITKNETITWKEYKLNRYKEIESKLDSIPYFNADDVVEAYYNAMKKDAQVFDSRDNVNSLRLSLYGIVKRATKDFTTGDIYGLNETIEISTAEQFVEELSKNTWGSYSITDDLDFSNIKVDKTYVTNRFIGQIDGNGHKFKGLKKPLFNEIVYGELQDVTIEGLSYESTTTAIIGLTTKNLVLSNVVAENMLINIPFAKTKNGNYLELGSTAIKTSDNVINTVEDLIKIGSDDASRKKSYIINADIDCSSITNGDSIISGVFSGTIDGNGYTLSNLKIPLLNNLQGSVKNLKIDGMTYSNTSVATVGALAKQATNSTVEHVYLNNITISARESIGSLIGVITNTNISYVDANDIDITGGSVTNGFYTGGLVGRSFSSNMKNISVKGDVTIYSTHNGGLVGAIVAPYGTFENIFVNVNINRPQNTDSRNRNGGIFGEIEKFPASYTEMAKRPVFKNCVSVGNMDASVYKIGGGVSSGGEGALVYNSANHTNVYECQESTGQGNVGSGSNIKEASRATLQSKGFYTGTLGWTEDIWDFSDMINGPSIK